MIDFYLSFPGDILVNIKSSESIVFDDITRVLMGAYLPGAKFIENIPRMADIEFEYKQSDSQEFIQKGSKILFKDNWETKFPLDFYHLLYSMVRVEWLKRNIFSVHAGCVGVDDYILIVGHTGVGKTSTILELLKDHDVRMFSGNKTLVSFNTDMSLNVLAGTKTITINKEDFQRHSGNTNYIKYDNRGAFIPDNYTDEAKPIRAIAIISLSDGVREKTIVNRLGALHKLYPYFLDTVNSDTILFDGKEVFTGTPSSGVQQYLARFLSGLVAKTPIYIIKGDVSFVAGSIKSL